MPAIKVVLFKEEDGTVPLLDWLEAAQVTEGRGQVPGPHGAIARVWQRTAAPEADYLRDGIYELRTKVGRVRYRMLYFFHGRAAAIVSHGLIKPGAAVEPKEIEKAIGRKDRFEKDPKRHTHEEG